MNLSLLPLLQIQRELYAIPRGFERFKTYIATMTGGGDDLVLPLSGMNPMGKDHIPALIDHLLQLHAEAVAEQAIAEAEQRLPKPERMLQVGLVVIDDLLGGWTNRYFTDLQLRFEDSYTLRGGWIVVLIWTGDTWDADAVYRAVLVAVYRVVYQAKFGLPQTLEALLAQEGAALRFAGAISPVLDADDLAYTRSIIQPYLPAREYPVLVACLFGDHAARSVGYPPLGFSEYAGLALALHDAGHAQITPEELLQN